MAAATIAMLDGHDGKITFAPQESFVPAERIGIDAGHQFFTFALQLLAFGLDQSGPPLKLGFRGIGFAGEILELGLFLLQSRLELVEPVHEFEFDIFHLADVRFGFVDFLQQRLILGIGFDLVELRPVLQNLLALGIGVHFELFALGFDLFEFGLGLIKLCGFVDQALLRGGDLDWDSSRLGF